MFNLWEILFGKKSIFHRSTVSIETEDRIKSDWNSIASLLKGNSPSQLRQALITADRSLDSALKDVSKGTTMGERLKYSADKFDRVIYNKIWEAHKIRNRLVHEADYEPPYFMLTTAIDDLRQGLRALQIRI